MIQRFTIITIIAFTIAINSALAKHGSSRIIQIDSARLKIEGSLGDFNRVFYLRGPELRGWNEFNIVGNDSCIALVSEYASEIYISKGDSLFKQGWSDLHYALQHSAYAIFQGRIYGFGGYGYWTTKNILRYWDQLEGWIPVVTSEDSPTLLPSHNATLLFTDSTAHIIGGEVSDSRNPFSRKPNYTIQKVNLRNRSVQIKQIHHSLNNDQFLFTIGDSALFLNNGDLIIYDLKSQKLYEAQISQEFYKALKHDLVSEKNGLVRIKKSNEGYNSFRLKEFIIQKKLDDNSILYLFIAIAFFVVMGVLLRRRRLIGFSTQDSLLNVNAKRLIHGSNQYVFTSIESALMALLIENESVNSATVNSLFPDEISLSHKNKIRNESIRKINQQAATLMQDDHFVLIKSEKDKSDLRMTSYSLNKEEVCVIDI